LIAMDISGFFSALASSQGGQAIVSPVTRLLDMGAQSYWLTYVSGMCVAAIFYLWSRRKKTTSLKGMFGYVLPKKLLLHVSTRLDLQLFIIGSIYLTFQGAILFGSLATSRVVVYGISYVFGPGEQSASPGLFIALLTPVLLFLALELGYWFAHWLMHRYVWLWEFHKVHHSAEVLTPLTEWRQHPVELLLFPVIANLSIGSVQGTITWFFGEGPPLLPFWSMSTILIVFFFTILHLRHSHVKMNVPVWLGCIIQSPGYHQIHHSTKLQHFNRNLGYCLSVWDWTFGTLYHPDRNEKLSFGIEGDGTYQTFTGCMLEPFKNMGRKLIRKKNA
jgi:sterol desaturase/sphingolipid hydroxylase (fatty acid hydroxylase superfamily)